jgi:hypothetical protein
MKIEHCKSCGAKIVWMRTVAGKFIPVDADTVQEGDVKFIPISRHVSHFATCPQSKKWRKDR